MVICSMPECQTTAGCKCNQLIPPTSIRHGKATIRYLPPDPAMADRELIELLRKRAQMRLCTFRLSDEINAECFNQAADRLSALSAEVERLRDEVRVRRIADHDVLADEVMRLREENRRLINAPYVSKQTARAALSAEAPGRKE